MHVTVFRECQEGNDENCVATWRNETNTASLYYYVVPKQIHRMERSLWASCPQCDSLKEVENGLRHTSRDVYLSTYMSPSNGVAHFDVPLFSRFFSSDCSHTTTFIYSLPTPWGRILEQLTDAEFYNNFTRVGICRGWIQLTQVHMFVSVTFSEFCRLYVDLGKRVLTSIFLY